MPLRPGWLAPALLPLVTLLNCGGCERAGSKELEPISNEVDVSEMGSLPETFEFAPADPRLRQMAGEMDVKNRYVSTVMLSLKDPRELPDCSGILLAPRLVLTAGSCVCALKAETAQSAGEQIRADASSCAARVFVTTVVYGEVGDSKLKELTTQMEFQTSEGSVRPHPRLELVLDKRGFVLDGRADLAVVLLDEPSTEGAAEVLLAREGAQVGESLIMAGYGHDDLVGGFYGARYFRKNRVVDVRTTERERVIYEQQGAYAYNGFAGGPCFREEGDRQWLIGVASARADQELTCTSTTVYRNWVRAELRSAESLEAARPPGP